MKINKYAITYYSAYSKHRNTMLGISAVLRIEYLHRWYILHMLGKTISYTESTYNIPQILHNCLNNSSFITTNLLLQYSCTKYTSIFYVSF